MSSNDESDMFPPEHYEAIGRLIIACTRLDALMTDLICRFGHMTPKCGLMTVHHQQFSSKIDTLKALIDAGATYYSDVPDGLITLINKAKELHDYRSTLVHAAWVVGDAGSPSTERITARGKLRESKQHQPTRKIFARALEADAVADLIEDLRDQIH